MEPTTRFDLNDAVRGWREELGQQAGLSEEALRELQHHLAESMDGLCRLGLAEEEAFLVARHRVGPAARLGEEFRKADPAALWRNRILWMVAGWGTMMLWNGLVTPAQMFTLQRFSAGSASGIAPQSVWAQLVLMGTYTIIGLLPLCLAVLLARGRLMRLTRLAGPLFSSRLRAGSSLAFLAMLTLGIGQFLPFWWGSVHSYGFPGLGLLAAVAGRAAVQGALLGLLVGWLMPKQASPQPI